MDFSDPTGLCRLCLSGIPIDEQEGVDLRSSTALDYTEIIQKCFSLLLEDAPNWPSRICQPCATQVNQFSDFHALVHLNQEVILHRFGCAFQMEEEDTKYTPVELIIAESDQEPTIEERPSDSEPLINPLSVNKAKKNKKEKPPPTVSPTRRSIREKRQIYDLNKKTPPKPRISTRGKHTSATIQEVDEAIRSFMTLKCNQCENNEEETTFDTFPELAFHWRSVHGSHGHVSCCGLNFNRRYTLHRHIELHEDPNRYQCDECPKAFVNRYLLAQHKDGHLPEEKKAFVCSVCGKRFPREVQLRSHEIRIHTPMTERPFACPDCGKRFINHCEVGPHQQRVHQKLRPFFCDRCAHSFATKGGFMVHKRVHEDHPRVACDECGKFYSSATQVKNHKKRAHLKGGQVFECPECGSRSMNATALTSHIRRAHKLAPNGHQCEVCGKGYKILKNLQEHMASHTGQRLYSCKFCELMCNSSANMYKHQKTKHPLEYEAMKKEREKKWFNERVEERV